MVPDGGPEDAPAIARRTYLGALASLAGATSLAGCSATEPGEDADTTPVADDRARELAERFAPTLYFDAHERWFPTDPSQFETERDGETVVDGFAALDGYTDRVTAEEGPPAPTLFYHAVRYVDSTLGVVQFWAYSAFDQFTTNFHWHDWEVLHVFVDLDTGVPQLYVASSHSGRVPNNEYLDPQPTREPRILSELGSHSSALSVNGAVDQFRRFPAAGGLADITNSAIEGVEDLADVPVAYGLPRDEGYRLPYLVPELEDAPLPDHDRLPSVGRDDLVADELTVGSFAELASPPADLPSRSTGMVFGHGDEGPATDVEYDLAPTSDLEHIAAFTGPRLGFEFVVPEIVEDAVASHITTTAVPWDQGRYDAPAEDVSDPTHRAVLAERYEAIGEAAPVSTLVASVTEAVSDDDAPEGEGVTTQDLTVEGVALVESEAEAAPTFGGVVALRDVPPGEHRLTVNGAGVEPHAETVSVGDGVTAAGVEGEIPVVAREHSTKLEVDAGGTADDLTDLAIEDDFGGRLYDAPFSESDAVYVHRGGAYTAEVRDAADEIGAVRVNPVDESTIRIEEPRTGTGSLAEYLADVAEESAEAVAAVDGAEGAENAVQGLARALEAVGEAARRAASRAAAGDRGRADENLAAVQDRLDRVSSRLAEADEDLPNDLGAAIDRRLDQLRRRSEQARAAGKL